MEGITTSLKAVNRPVNHLDNNIQLKILKQVLKWNRMRKLRKLPYLDVLNIR